MKQAISILGLLACAHVAAFADQTATPASNPPAPAAAAVKPEATTADGAQLFTLKNGMQLIVKPDKRAPTAVHMVWVRVGSVDEVDGTTGVFDHPGFKSGSTGVQCAPRHTIVSRQATQIDGMDAARLEVGGEAGTRRAVTFQKGGIAIHLRVRTLAQDKLCVRCL